MPRSLKRRKYVYAGERLSESEANKVMHLYYSFDWQDRLNQSFPLKFGQAICQCEIGQIINIASDDGEWYNEESDNPPELLNFLEDEDLTGLWQKRTLQANAMLFAVS